MMLCQTCTIEIVYKNLLSLAQKGPALLLNAQDILVKHITNANNETSDKPAQMHSLARAFTARTH